MWRTSIQVLHHTSASFNVFYMYITQVNYHAHYITRGIRNPVQIISASGHGKRYIGALKASRQQWEQGA